MPKPQPKLYEIDEEIFAEGIWNGMGFDVKDLKKLADTFNELADVHQVPLKFGHNEEQKMTDGEPALGWVEKLWVEGTKLMGKFVDVPEIVYEAMTQKKYRNKSIELDLDVDYKGTKYEHVLSGVALLGADIPAVNTLNDLSYYLASRRAMYAAANHMSFTTNKEEHNMSEVDDLKAKVVTLEQSIGVLKGENETLKTASANFERQVEDFEKKEKEREKEAAKLEFDRNVETFKTEVEQGVKDKCVTPATRDKLVSDITDADSLERAKFSLSIMKENGPVITSKAAGFSRKAEDEDEGDSPDKIVASRVSKLQGENSKLSYAVAKRMVFEQDEDLARAYVNMT